MMADWHYEPASDLDQPIMERLRRFPREPDILHYGIRSLAACVIRGWLRFYHRFQIVGSENLPKAGPYVLVANHSSHLDALCLLSALRISQLHRAFPAAAADYFFVSLPRLAVSVFVINALPFHRELHIRQSLSLCRELLMNNNMLILFPEGTRSTDGQMSPFKPGIGRLLANTPFPVIPCYLNGTARGLPKGAWMPRPAKIRMIVGKPRTYMTAGQDKEAVLHICSDLYDAVSELSELAD
jgi:1-acyl-sn-glycerol-3-phosphate acyltransferase